MRLLSPALAAILVSVSLNCFPAVPDGVPAEVSAILSELPDNRIELDYSFSIVQDDVPVLFSGHAILQQHFFHISGNGFEVFCDGGSVTYMDSEAKEAYVESGVAAEDYIRNNLQSVRNLKISNVSKTPATDGASAFRAPVPDSDWVITDLR